MQQLNSCVIEQYRYCTAWSLTLTEDRRLRVFENRVLGITFGPKRGEVRGDWRQVHNEDLNGLYCSPNVIRVIKSRIARWAGHITCKGRGRREVRTELWWVNFEERDHLEDPVVDGRIVLRWIFRKWDGGHRLD